MDNTPDSVFETIEILRGGGKYRYPWSVLRDQAEILARRCQAYRIYGFQVDKVWRARRIDIVNKPTTIADLGHPRSVTDYGRCHTPDSPIFYCAARCDVALAEVDADLGRHYAISCFKVKEQLSAIAIGEFDYYWRTGAGYFGREIANDYDDYHALCNRDDAHVLKAIDAFFADEFMKPAYTTRDYRLTSAIAEVLLRWPSKRQVDALVYPSVSFREGLNFAIIPNSFQSKLELVPDETHIREITDVPGFGIFGYRYLDHLTDVTPSGELSWRGGK